MFEIKEVVAYRAADGSLALVSDLVSLTAYQVNGGTVFESRDTARSVLITSAIQAIGGASPDVIAAAAQNANSDDANLARYAILYLASVIKGEA
jgi:hypothetical protein